MKLSSVLLTSAATLMMTSVAFAADLPSKKAAPSAGAVQVCKVGGMTGFTLPGSDTCLKISGRVTVDFGWADDHDFLNSSPFGEQEDYGDINYRLNFDARSNSDMGVIRSFVSFTNNGVNDYGLDSDWANYTGVRKAFIQVGGFTAGLKDSIADIAGTVGNFYGSGMNQAGYGVDYQVAVGDMNFAIAAEYSQQYDERPDIIARVQGKAGTVNYTLAGVSALDGDGDQVFAALGQINTSIGSGVSLYAFGGYGDATDFIDNGSADDGVYNSVFGAGLTFEVSKQLSVTVEGRSNDGDDYSDSEQNYAVSATYTVAKGLFVAPEVVMYDNGNSTMYVRIQRDF